MRGLVTSGGWRDGRGGRVGSLGRNEFVGWVEDLMQEKSGERYAMIEVRPDGYILWIPV